MTAPDPLVRLRAVRAVPDRGPSRDGFLPQLRKLKDDPSPEVRAAAATARERIEQTVP